jgi:hypothetical protein
MRLLWPHGAILSLRKCYAPTWSKRTEWQHNGLRSAHIVTLKLGQIRLIRYRQTADHARRLGLPVV